jgi:hypothetical protein
MVFPKRGRQILIKRTESLFCARFLSMMMVWLFYMCSAEELSIRPIFVEMFQNARLSVSK